ncbi:MAG TPA: DUF998 domain-containing protein [Trebonia sp.]
MNENVKDVPWWGAVSAAAAPLLLIAGITVASQLQPPQFNALHNTVSALAGQGAADRWVMTFTFAVVAACEILTALALRPASWPGRVVLVAAGFAGAMVAVFPERLGGSLIHAFWAGAGFGALMFWPALAWRRGPGVPWALRPVACAVACAALSALLIWFAVEEAVRGGQMGLSERALGVTQTFWPLLVVFSCRRHRSGEVPAVDVAPM